MTTSQEIVIRLLRVALGRPVGEAQGDIGSGAESVIGYGQLTPADWTEVMDFAFEQGVAGIAFEGVERLPDDCRPDLDNLMEWFGQVEYMKADYRRHREAVAELASFYEANGLRMLLLKGYGLSKYWPVREHRPVGDVDVYLFGDWKRADRLVREKLGIEVDNGHHHHSVFHFRGTMVENHYDFINTKAHPSSKVFEKRLKQLARVEDCKEDGEIRNLYYPSVDFNALFLLKHASLHFASTEMSLRQLLDWLLFVKAEGENVDWKGLYVFLREQGLDGFANVLNAIGMRYLGFPKGLFYEVSEDEGLVERVMGDILQPEFREKEDGSLLSGLWVKPRRFWRNRWKHRLCYKDSLWSGFWWGLWAKVLKPGHLKV